MEVIVSKLHENEISMQMRYRDILTISLASNHMLEILSNVDQLSDMFSTIHLITKVK